MWGTDLFAAWPVLLSGALTGLIFGFLLQKGGATRYPVIVGQFLLRDFTVLKIMLTAVVVGGIGVYAMLGLGWIDGLSVKATHLLANGAGGLIFGIGMALLGYCPGTGVAAVGDGARDAVPGIVGMLVGAGLYAAVYPWMDEVVLPVGELGKLTLPDAAGLSPWWFLLLLGIAAVALFRLIDRATAGGRVEAEGRGPAADRDPAAPPARP